MKYSFILFVLFFNAAFAQKSLSDSLDTGKSVEDSIMYAKLKQKMNKSKVGKSIYGAVFRDVYNSRQNKEIKEIEINPFEKYDGKVIGKIIIKKLEIFCAECQ